MPPSKNTEIKELLKNFLSEVTENAASISRFSTELKSFIKSMEPLLRLFYGSDHKESIETRLRLLEEKIKSANEKHMLPECQKQIDEVSNKAKLIQQAIDNLGGEINKLWNDTSNVQGLDIRIETLEKETERKNKDEKEKEKEKQTNIKGILMELMKWILAITAAVIIAKLTGKV